MLNALIIPSFPQTFPTWRHTCDKKHRPDQLGLNSLQPVRFDDQRSENKREPNTKDGRYFLCCVDLTTKGVLNLFPRFRVWCQKVIGHKMFDYIILLFIFLNCITIALERPDIQPNSMVTRANALVLLWLSVE